MCGRYYRKGEKQKIAEAFHAKLVEDGTPSPPGAYALLDSMSNREKGRGHDCASPPYVEH